MSAGGLARVCVIGHPIRHSLSPVLHSGWLEDLGLAGIYEALDIPPTELAATIHRLKAEGYRGANVTIPHKETVRAFLDSEDESARAIGAVNTLIIENGCIAGSNTDALGYVTHLGAMYPGWREDLGRRPVLVLGSGGSARGVVLGLAQAGVRHFLVANRDRDRARRLGADFAALARIEAVGWPDREAAAAEAGLIINATPLGMKAESPLALNLVGAKRAIISDLVYNPIETPLLSAARARGLPVLDGLGMLMHQGRASFRAWFGVAPPVDARVRARLLAALSQA